MTTNNPNFMLLRMYVDTIPPYDGNPHCLTSFISTIDFLFETYGVTNDEALKSYLIRIVRIKLTQRAQILVGNRLELKTWEQIKNALIDCFGDKRNLECLEQDLLLAMPNKNENPLDFGKRLQILRSNLVQKINSFTTQQMDEPTKLIYLRQYEQATLRTFIRGLSFNLQNIIRIKTPNCLEEALSLVTEEQNFHYFQNSYKNLHQNNSFTNYPTNNNYNNYNTNVQNAQTKPAFPTGPINIQTRPVPPRRFPTNAEVFGKPKNINVFKPTGQTPTNKPEPMSTTSRNSSLQYKKPNFFKPSGPRNFISEELHQIDENLNDSSKLNHGLGHDNINRDNEGQDNENSQMTNEYKESTYSESFAELTESNEYDYYYNDNENENFHDVSLHQPIT